MRTRMNDIRIEKIPPLPNEIKEAVDNDNLAVFVGAGVSRIVGCDGWNQLAKNLVDKCFRLNKSNSEPCINYKERDFLINDYDHKKPITICYSLLKENNYEEEFFETLDNSLIGCPKILKTQNIYDELIKLHGLFITTNVDQHFDNKFETSRILYQGIDFDMSRIDRTNLYHIHGSMLDRKSLIFRVDDYLERYNDIPFKDFLKEIFKKYVLLFIGYGLTEFELLNFIVEKFDTSQPKELKKFSLQPYYKGEENILRLNQFYYDRLGISIIGYELDEKGYFQLYDIIKDWNIKINQTSTYLYDAFKDIDEAIDYYEE
jgi:hypothetical protein